jgi:hypothetical protein
MSETAEMPIMDSECPFRHELNPYSNLGDSTARTNYFIFQAGMKTGFREAEEELTKLRAALDDAIDTAIFYSNSEEFSESHPQLDWSLVNNPVAIQDQGKFAREFLSKHKELIKGEV